MTEHLFVVADPDLVKFLHIVGVYGQEFDAFIQGKCFVHGFLEHPEVKREPADIAIGIFVFAHMGEIDMQM